MKRYFAYIRVSTDKQGEHGVSLQEQREILQRYASHKGLEIAEWFEEKETASKVGRPIFNGMLRLLKKGSAAGVIIHKVDRGARNFRDWAEIGELVQAGIEVHFATESPGPDHARRDAFSRLTSCYVRALQPQSQRRS